MDGNLPKLTVRLDELIESVRMKPNVSHTSIKRTLAELFVHLLHIASTFDQEVEYVLEGDDPYIWVLSQKDTPTIRNRILKVCSLLIDTMVSQKKRQDKRIIRAAKEYIAQNLGNAKLSQQDVSASVGLTSSYFSYLFSQETGEGINAYITRNRVAMAKELLGATKIHVDLIAVQTGFSTAKYFASVFKKNTNMTPTQYRKKTNIT